MLKTFLETDAASFVIRLLAYIAFSQQLDSYYYGALLYYFLDLIVLQIILEKFFGLKMMRSGADQLCMELNINVCFYVTLDQKLADLEQIKSQILKNHSGTERFQSIVVKLLGQYYYKRLKDQRLIDQFNKAFIIEEGPIKDQNDFEKFVLRAGRDSFRKEELGWKIYLVKEYKEKSVLFFKCSHSITDGIGALLFACGIQQNPTKQQQPLIRQHSVKERFLKRAILPLTPFYMAKEAYELEMVNSNKIKQFNTTNNEYQWTESSRYQIDELKIVCKKMKCTINDLLMTILSTSLTKYCQEISESDGPKSEMNLPQQGALTCIINFREPPTSIKEMRIGGNYMYGHKLNFLLSQDFGPSLKLIKEQMDEFKNSYRQLMFTCMTTIAAHIFPRFMKDIVLNNSIRTGMKVNVTNICGPEVPLKFGDSSISEEIMFVNFFLSELTHLQLSVLSHCGTLKMVLSIGKMKVDAKILMSMIEENLHKLRK